MQRGYYEKSHNRTVPLRRKYTLTGLKRSESNGSGTTLLTYDPLGRVTQESFSSSAVNTEKNYGYNIGDSRTSFTLAVGGVQQFNTTYGYDALKRLINMTEGMTTATYGYTTNGNRDYVQYNNGLREEYSYNLANLVTMLTNKNSGGDVLSQYTYSYTLDGNQTSKTDQTGKINTYAYDGLGRLVSEAETSGGQTQTYTYSYDDCNNRSSLSAAGPDTYSTSYFYDLNNRLITESKTIGNSSDITSYFYDPNGNQVTKTTASLTVGSGTVSYELTEGLADSQLNRYNGINQLVEVRSGNDTVVYTYFASGLRASKAIGGTKTDYVLDGDNVVLELTSGVATSKYIRGINLVSSIIGNTTSYYLYNAHGDVVHLANTSGANTKTYDYDAFGVEKNKDDNDTNPFRYCGEYYDLETNTYYLRARYYDPTIGRFLSEDSYCGTATDPLSLNLYIYCKNNPIMFIDPSGMTAVIIRDVGEAFGGTVSYDEDSNTATVTIGITSISYTVGVNGVYFNENGRMMVDDSAFKNDFDCNYFVVDDSKGYTAFKGSITQSYTKDGLDVITLYEGAGFTIKDNVYGEKVLESENRTQLVYDILLGASVGAGAGAIAGAGGTVIYSGGPTVAQGLAWVLTTFFGVVSAPDIRCGDTILTTSITTFVGPGPTVSYAKIYNNNRKLLG